MAERGTNFYYPPDFDPRKHGSANGYQGVHHLRERARKIDQGIIIIRFEMPYNIWCEGCNNHIGMGVRYNAEKTRTGKYYSTIIYKFRMKCHLCDNYFEIQTDPANLDYTILSGARRQERRWDPDTNDQIAAEDSDKVKKLATDAMFKLEHGVNDKAKLQKAIPILEQIRSCNEKMKDDYTTNQLLRKEFRAKRKQIAHETELDKDLLARSSLSIPLVKERDQDKKLAKLLHLQAASSSEEVRQKRRQDILQQSIFPSAKSSTASTSSSKKALLEQIARRAIQKKSLNRVNKLSIAIAKKNS